MDQPFAHQIQCSISPLIPLDLQAKRACESRLLFASLPWKEKKKDRRFSPIKRKSDLPRHFFADEPGFRRMLDGCGVRSRRRLWLNKINEANFSIQAFRSNNYSSLCFRCILNLHRNEGSLLKLFLNTWINETFFGHNWQLVNKTPCVNYTTTQRSIAILGYTQLCRAKHSCTPPSLAWFSDGPCRLERVRDCERPGPSENQDTLSSAI